jgi:hypothetical protein
MGRAYAALPQAGQALGVFWAGGGRAPLQPANSATEAATDIEAVWLRRLNARATPVFTSTFSLALLAAARMGAE